MTASPPPLSPALAERFEVRRVLGQGGFGRVLLVFDREAGREVALKLLAAAPEQAEARDRFLREARVTAGLHHPGVLRVFDAGITPGGEVYLVSEVLEPGLEDAPGPAQVRRWAEQVGGALAAAHRVGLVHRDVKAANVLRRGDDAVLCDFGLVRVDGSQTVRTATGIVLGTPRAMAPELFRGEPATPASDQWAWAATFHEALTGRGVYPSEDLAAILEAARDFRPPVPPGGGAEGEAFHAVLARALATRPEDRFLSMEAAVAAWTAATEPPVRGPEGGAKATVVLDSFSDSPGSPSSPGSPGPGEEGPPPGGRRWWALPAMVAVAVVAGALAPVSPVPRSAPGGHRPGPLAAEEDAAAGAAAEVEAEAEIWGEVVGAARALREALGVAPGPGEPVLAYFPPLARGGSEEPGFLHRDVPELWDRFLRLALEWGHLLRENGELLVPGGPGGAASRVAGHLDSLLVFHRIALVRFRDQRRRFLGYVAGGQTRGGRAQYTAIQGNSLQAFYDHQGHRRGPSGIPLSILLLPLPLESREREEASVLPLLREIASELPAYDGDPIWLPRAWENAAMVVEWTIETPCEVWSSLLVTIERSLPEVGADRGRCQLLDARRREWLDLLRKCRAGGGDQALERYEALLREAESCLREGAHDDLPGLHSQLAGIPPDGSGGELEALQGAQRDWIPAARRQGYVARVEALIADLRRRPGVTPGQD